MPGWAQPPLCPPRGWAAAGSGLLGILGEFWLRGGGGGSIWHCSSRDLFLSSCWRWEGFFGGLRVLLGSRFPRSCQGQDSGSSDEKRDANTRAAGSRLSPLPEFIQLFPPPRNWLLKILRKTRGFFIPNRLVPRFFQAFFFFPLPLLVAFSPAQRSCPGASWCGVWDGS